jgi:FkbM family methyltransferase
MTTFEKLLKNKIRKSIFNNYKRENYDEFRFGKYQDQNDFNLKPSIVLKNKIKKILNYDKIGLTEQFFESLTHKKELNWLWNILNEDDKALLVELIAYRLLGYKKVKLSVNNEKYHSALSIANKLADPNDSIDTEFMQFVLHKMNLEPIGKPIQFYFSPVGVAIDFILEQYAYKQNNKSVICAEDGDIVLDLGACWGDTALYFAEKVGDKGKVYSFEFIPKNIEIFHKNIEMNPILKSRIELVPQPVSDKNENTIFFMDCGPASQIKTAPFTEQTGSASTITIDDFVLLNNVQKVDFIKMDIEGAEPAALKGAINTIKNFKPKLAIAIYHSMSDFVNIPRWIYDLDLGYDLYLGHYTIHAEETVIYAKPRK